MKIANILSLSTAAISLALLAPQLARSQGAGSMNIANAGGNQAAAQQEAKQMVPAEVHLERALDARKERQGDQFEALLDGKVHLADGTELEHGTVLVGKIVTDQMRPGGNSRLALKFTEAKLRDGKVIPIHAMIAGISGPSENFGYLQNSDGPPNWTRGSLQIDEIGVEPHLDLHSRVAGANSGVLVSSTKDDVKLAAGSRMTLAIAARNAESSGGA
ncbi:MAG TPA: hypothetical protein VMD55_10725 [Terracidiphilus sp.]|jgi:hypothetical protein|nr:hypothetical protein [Terracidiphilus sp.]